MKKARIAAALIFAVLITLAAAAAATSHAAESPTQEEYSLKLLAVSETGEKGVTADLYLRTAPGTGNVFIEAEPVTKLDTRISLKLAKEIACQSIQQVYEECGNHDFFFRIDANASLLGGPSAGAAAAALTIAALDDASINPSVAVTGTITSGGLIGEVGGLKEKIEAAAEGGLSKVLIPGGERYYKGRNRTATASALDLAEYGKSLGIKVEEASDIQEALLQLTGKNYSEEEKTLEIDKRYSDVMGKLATEICGQSTELSKEASEIDIAAIAKNIEPKEKGNASQQATPKENPAEELRRALEAAKDSASAGLEEKRKGSHYSAASRCFGSNVRYSYLLLLNKNLSYHEALLQINQTAQAADSFEKEIPKAETLSAMQARGNVMERLEEARQLLKLSREDLEKQDYNDGIYRLAFANERLGSAKAWNRFLTPDSSSEKALQAASYATESLRNGCVARLQEADEHIQYLDVYLPGILNNKEELGPVYSYLRQGDYTSCIYKASISKAKANAMLSALSGNENLTKLVSNKLKAAKESIVRQTSEGDFPIISYSYYEYSNSLKDTDLPSALLYSEYALELSNLQVYLNHNAKTGPSSPVEGSSKIKTAFTLIVAGAIGFAAGLLFFLAAKASAGKATTKKRLLIRKTKN
ncbi:hypothetical protein HYU40_05215 [Candidatus Woesearchaeota archaeon]|nr:hypothetical protein [Candidatus Woesearchaeota archaeon]